MARRFTVSEIELNVTGVKNGAFARTQNPVYNAWSRLVDDWLTNADDDTYFNGFVGFKDRSVDDIVEDFRENGLLREPNEPEPNEPEHNEPENSWQKTPADYVHELESGGSLELDVEDGVIRYLDQHGNCEDIYRPEDENDKYDEYRALFDAPTLIDLENALQEAQDNFSAETGGAVEEIIDTLPESVDLVPLWEEFEWVFDQVGRQP